MSTTLATPIMSSALAGESVSRKPQQGRSIASLERMLAAAEKLMLERGSEDFTLQDVSKTGNVSIGSIYLRFDGKDDLVRAVLSDHLDRMVRAEDEMMKVLESTKALTTLVPQFVECYAELLKEHAPLLRLTMQRASYDPLVSQPGKQTAFRIQSLATAAMMRFSNEIGGAEKELKASSSYHIIFATLARQLSLGSTGESVHDYDWTLLKRELASMCLAYLCQAR
jgi:AcrR family transcriptional regulator